MIESLEKEFESHPYGLLLASGENLGGEKRPAYYPTKNWTAGFSHTLLENEENPLSIPDQEFGHELMGYWSYDCKNYIEPLHSRNPDRTGFPSHAWWKPTMKLSGTTLLESGDFSLPRPVFIPCSSADAYELAVEDARNCIREGIFYEINICREFVAQHVEMNPFKAFVHLFQQFPNPFSAFLKVENRYALCFSPERFLLKKGKTLISQPIKGTAARSVDPIEDLRNKRGLAESEKERAENVMIVDLVRNDLSRVSRPGSVQVSELFGLYSFPSVHQMISTIESESLAKSHEAIMRATFPMGSMTGAPKIEVMKQIDRLENFSRGLFSGSIGRISPEGDFDFNVVIRSLFYDADKKELVIRAGSAITYDSVARQERDECRLKAMPLVRALGGTIAAE